MNISVIILIFGSVIISTIGQTSTLRSPSIRNNLFNGTFHTKLDHTRPRDPRKAIFTYHANELYYKPSGPFYIYIKDEGDYSTQWIETGLMVDIAQDTNAFLLTFDLRYFGENIPTDNISYENLQYLTVEQILGDIATFIDFIKEAHHAYNSKIILWGSGIGGTLATWTKMKYPHLVDAVWSSSGIYDFNVATTDDFNNLNETVIGGGKLSCFQRVEDAFTAIDNLLQNENDTVIKNKLNLCRSLNTSSTYEVASLFHMHLEYILNYFKLYHVYGIIDFCRDMNAIEADPLESLVRWIDYIYVRGKCNEDIKSPSITRSLPALYLQCTQLGQFKITDSFSWIPNRIDLNYYYETCIRQFGNQYSSSSLSLANNGLKNQFGGLEQHVSNVIYTNGHLDPGLSHGMLQINDPTNYVINIECTR